jgi:hypothetical protein
MPPLGSGVWDDPGVALGAGLLVGLGDEPGLGEEVSPGLGDGVGVDPGDGLAVAPGDGDVAGADAVWWMTPVW